MPLNWSNDIDNPQIKEWLWLALVEVEPYEVPPDALDREKNWFQIDHNSSI